MFDLVVRNAKIVDGSGAAWFAADLAVSDPAGFAGLVAQAKAALQ